MKEVVSFIVGLLFSLGLGVSGMTQTHVVKGFLDVLGTWNPNLMGVMIGAIGVHFVLFKFIMRRTSPLLSPTFDLPTNKKVDAKLILGAAIFGLGWGWAGICPGPALVNLMHFQTNLILFVLSMLVTMFIYKKISGR